MRESAGGEGGSNQLSEATGMSAGEISSSASRSKSGLLINE